MNRTPLMALLGLATLITTTACFENEDGSVTVCKDYGDFDTDEQVWLDAAGMESGDVGCIMAYNNGCTFAYESGDPGSGAWIGTNAEECAEDAADDDTAADTGSDGDTAEPDTGSDDTGDTAEPEDTGSDDTGDTAEPEPVDSDGDGYDDTEDCDDADASVGPASTWYADADGDGSGDSADSTTACDQPDGYVDNADDCDDSDADLNESCESVDNDGDGYYADVDDCNDEDATVNPDYDYHLLAGTPVSDTGTWYVYAWDDYNWDFGDWINASGGYITTADGTDQASACYHVPSGYIVELNADNGSSGSSDDLVYSCSSAGSSAYYDSTSGSCSDVAFTWNGEPVEDFDFGGGYNMTLVVP